MKEKQSASGKARSSTSAPVSAIKTQDAVKKAVTGKAAEKRQHLEEKTRRKEEATRAPKPVFSGSRDITEPIAEAAPNFDSDEELEQEETIKRRPRTKQRKDWGPMPKDVGVDYLRQWDSRHS